MEEQWKIYQITHQEWKKPNVYEVSNFGRIRKNGEIIQPRIHSTGYYIINGELLHRIVAKLFIPNPENKSEVDHIDTNIHNNYVDNLRWVTSSENQRNPLTLQNMSKSLKGKNLGCSKPPASECTRLKMSESAKKRWSSKEERNKARAVAKKRWSEASEEEKRKNKERYKGMTWKVIDGKRIWIEKEES